MGHVNTDRQANRAYAKSLARAFAGAIIFSLPLLMTMEMWWLGFYLDREILLQFMLVNFLLLVGLSRVSGFEQTVNLLDDALDACAAYGIAALASAVVLVLFGIVMPGIPASEVVGKIAIQSVPASFGAMLASKQLAGGGDPETAAENRRRSGYPAQLFLMVAGALFLGLNVAPTEEMVLISFRMTPAQSIALVVISIALLHALVYTVGFKGEEQPDGPAGFVSTFLRFSITGYALAVVTSLYVLWTFGRTEGLSAPEIASMIVVLAFPGAIGAGIARLVV